MEHARLISIAQKLYTNLVKIVNYVVLRGLFEGAHYNSEAWAKCAVYSRARTKQGRGVIKEIRYLKFVATDFSPKTISPSAGENSGDLA